MENNTETKPKDFTNKSIKEIVRHFNFEYLHFVDLVAAPSRQDFYCGITGDIKANLSRHKVGGYAVCVQCDTYETASEVEKRLGEMGFDIGNQKIIGQGGNEKSRIVYMIEKTDSFKS